MRAIDTNVLVRAQVRDDAAQAARANALLSAHEFFIPVAVILELKWVLRSGYAFTPIVVAQAIEKIVSLGNVVVGERDAVLAATARAIQGWDFADALHHALSGVVMISQPRMRIWSNAPGFGDEASKAKTVPLMTKT